MTLKEARIKANLTQFDLSDLIKIPQSRISNYESGQELPDLENAVILQKKLHTEIDWQDNRTLQEKHILIQSIIELLQKFPPEMVSSFIARMYRREQYPDQIIINYGKIASNNSEVLYPPGTDIEIEDS